MVVWLEQKIQGKWRKLTRALFLMACRNATNTGASIVNPLKPANEEEERIYAGGESRTAITFSMKCVIDNICFEYFRSKKATDSNSERVFI